ncbi:hypothetical protein AMECASPLE_037624 [Ameca splendens]|uniref:Uncharacterized protein n=1 Tax=Ameca splendens TaxID=208324 RepID=A0ABV1A5Y4_9TELE
MLSAAEEEKLPSDHLQHQHVLCSSAAAVGCWILCEQLTQPASVTVQPGQHLAISCRSLILWIVMVMQQLGSDCLQV